MGFDEYSVIRPTPMASMTATNARRAGVWK